MLQKLYIKNYAIIKELSLDFTNGFNVLTGETGAGKSIIIGALHAVMGNRMDIKSNTIKDKIIIEASFIVHKRADIVAYLLSQEFDYTDILLIRREVSQQGKSRTFINDTPCSIQQLKRLSPFLFDLHQQFDVLDLQESSYQQEMFDISAHIGQLLSSFQSLYDTYQKIHTTCETLIALQEKNNQEKDYQQFILEELTALALQPNELEVIEQKIMLLQQSHDIQDQLIYVQASLGEGNEAILPCLKKMMQSLSKFNAFHNMLQTLYKRIESVHVEMQDIYQELPHFIEQFDKDESAIVELTDRLDKGNRLLQKHRVKHTDDLLHIQQSIAMKLQQSVDEDDKIKQLQQEAAILKVKCEQLAAEISKKRLEYKPVLEKKINSLLQLIGMPHAMLSISITRIPLSHVGIDQIEFLFDPNKTGKMEPIRKIASGGELSRLMLCMKSLVAHQMQLPTQIFDEIDSGISGEATKQVGILLKNMSKDRQIIVITHQPQIAAKADTHFFIYKEENREDKTIQTHIKILSKEERIKALAQMLGGELPSHTIQKTAEEMIEREK